MERAKRSHNIGMASRFGIEPPRCIWAVVGGYV